METVTLVDRYKVMEDKVHPVTVADELYDQDILTKRKCPKCGARIVSHPDCNETCSNENCESWHIRIDV